MLPTIFEKGPGVYAHVLIRENLNDECIIKCLRGMAESSVSPEINVAVKKEHLLSLPPIMRLKCLERILSDCRVANLSNLKEEDMDFLLFPSVARYPSRVQWCAGRFKFIKKTQVRPIP